MYQSRRQLLCLSMVTFATVSFARLPTGPLESTEVLRAQLELSVCDSRGAGTSDAVSATLSDGAPTWLDRPGPRLERGGRYSYDLSLDRVRILRDITALSVEKAGDDDLCVRELQLVVNGKAIFLRSFSGGVWLNDRTHRVLHASRAELRANSAWQGYTWSLAEWVASTGAAIPRQEVIERLESTIGNAMHDLDLSWKAKGEEPMRVRPRDGSAVSVTATLARRVGYWRDANVTLAFDMTLCANGRPGAAITNLSLNEAAPWYSFVHRSATDDERTINALRERLAATQPLVLVGSVCPRVDATANITY
jgi:hypothetical protein